MKNEELLDRAIAAIGDEPVDSKTMEAASARVAARLEFALRDEAAATAAALAAADGVGERIHGCADFQVLMPAYVRGALTESRRLLLEDHTRECVACRKALAAARRGESAEPVAASRIAKVSKHRALWVSSPQVRLALAAGIAAVAILGGVWMLRGFGPAPEVHVRAIQGELLAVGDRSVEALAAGALVPAGSALRTTKGSGALVELADGSKIELAERSEVAFAARRGGAAIRLARGRVIVEAAHRSSGHLYLEAGDCEVAVTGTVFAVDRGTRGSRVSVVDGEVHVKNGAERAVLRPGEQFATSADLGRIPVANTISWSRNADAYEARLAAVAALGHELEQTLAPGHLRNATDLLALAPAGSIAYAALPNVSGSLADAWQRLSQRVTENPALAEWWNEKMSGASAADIATAIGEIQGFGAYLGDEVAIAFPAETDGTPVRPIFYANAPNAVRFSPYLDDAITRWNAKATQGAANPTFVRVTDPARAVDSGSGRQLFLWLGASHFAASPSLARIADFAARESGPSSGFMTTPFGEHLAARYGEGVEWLFGVDLASVIHSDWSHSGGVANAAAWLGLDAATDLLIDSHGDGDSTMNRATLSFAGERQGVASWLAAPASMGALDFVSPDAWLAAGAVMKDPAAMLDDVLAQERAQNLPEAEKTAAFESKYGLHLRDDLAATLGGEAVFAFDGPVLPRPAWKLIVEVYDPSRLQSTIATLVDDWNRDAETNGRPTYALSQVDDGGRVVLELAATGAPAPLAVATVVDGYFVVASDRTVLASAIALRAAGSTLARSDRFTVLLPADGEANFSAFLYQDAANSVGSIGQWLSAASGMPSAERDRLSAWLGSLQPALALAYGEPDAISLTTRGMRGPLGLSLGNWLSLAGAAQRRSSPVARLAPGATGAPVALRHHAAPASTPPGGAETRTGRTT